jgi:outer membrane receptor protein involved in Fe transport
MNRTLGDPNLVLIKPYVLMSSNCVVPVDALQALIKTNTVRHYTLNTVCGGVLGNPVNPLGGPNDGAGHFTPLDGHELPNAPHWTVSFGAQYTWGLWEGWEATVRGDAYWQSQSWARVYNLDPYDKLHGWYNTNLSLWIENPDQNLKIEIYAKNALDDTPITDAFLNSDDAALTTNVFVLDPRLIGLSITKGF